MSDSKDKNISLDSEDETYDLMSLLEMASGDVPSSDLLFGNEERDDSAETINSECFSKIEKVLEDTPSSIFKDKDYYQKALIGENDVAKRFHKLLSSYLNTEDNKERSDIRPKLISAYWNFAESIASKSNSVLSAPKRFTLRFGSVLPNLLSYELRTLLSRVIVENQTEEPVHYVDEWLKMVADGKVSSSAIDEVKPSQAKKTDNLRPQIEKYEGQKNAFIHLIKEKQNVISEYENQLIEKGNYLKSKFSHPEFHDLKLPYDENQKQYLNNIAQNLKNIQQANKQLTTLFADLDKNIEIINQLKLKNDALEKNASVDSSVLVKEFVSIQQMSKMSVGRKGNHVPILMKQYFSADMINIGTRENVINIAANIEEIDSGVFMRTFRRETRRIVPHFILLPCYGEKGICWEPFEKYNRGTSRGRVAIPMYSKDLKVAVIAALGDLRWQVSKEKGQHYWMEEGLTGRYYQWFSENKMKGDVRERFILDYILWITKESEGTQKLSRDVRGIFWRELPFPEKIRNNLKNRGFVYSELYKKDLNRARSDGY